MEHLLQHPFPLCPHLLWIPQVFPSYPPSPNLVLYPSPTPADTPCWPTPARKAGRLSVDFPLLLSEIQRPSLTPSASADPLGWPIFTVSPIPRRQKKQILIEHSCEPLQTPTLSLSPPNKMSYLAKCRQKSREETKTKEQNPTKTNPEIST